MIDEATFHAKAEALEAALRDLGLYMDTHRWITQDHQPDFVEDPDGTVKDRSEEQQGSAVLLASFHVGDVAFTKRVQDPEQVDWDRSFAELKIGMMEEDIEAARREYLGEDS